MVNKITLQDALSFYNLGEQVHSKFATLFSLEMILKSDFDYLYGFYIENSLVAFIHIQKIYETIDIINLVVDSSFRKKGIATSLLLYILEHFYDVSSIMLEVNEKNKAALSLYKKFNFKIINKRKFYYGADTALIMKKEVNNERC